MKHIKFFKTKAERDAAVIERPYVIYTKDVNSIEFADEYPIKADSNPELMTVLYNLGWAENSDFMTKEECEAVTDAMLASSVTSNTSAFTSVITFNELIYFKNLSIIPDYCFYNCSNLNSIQFPKGIISIGSFAFSKCGSLTDLELPSNLQTLGEEAFSSVPLNLVVIPASCQNIGRNAFCIAEGETLSSGTRRIDLSLTNLTSTPYGMYENSVIWVKFPSTCVSSAGLNIIGTSGYSYKGWLWFDCTSPYTGTYGDIIGEKKVIRVYVPDEYVDVWKSSSAKYNNSKIWSNYASNIYPHSQWETDKNNGVIDV